MRISVAVRNITLKVNINIGANFEHEKGSMVYTYGWPPLYNPYLSADGVVGSEISNIISGRRALSGVFASHLSSIRCTGWVLVDRTFCSLEVLCSIPEHFVS